MAIMRVQVESKAGKTYLYHKGKILLRSPQELLAIGRDTANHPGATHHRDITSMEGPDVHLLFRIDSEGRQFVTPLVPGVYIKHQGNDPRIGLAANVETPLIVSGQGFGHYNDIYFGTNGKYRARVHSLAKADEE